MKRYFIILCGLFTLLIFSPKIVSAGEFECFTDITSEDRTIHITGSVQKNYDMNDIGIFIYKGVDAAISESLLYGVEQVQAKNNGDGSLSFQKSLRLPPNSPADEWYTVIVTYVEEESLTKHVYYTGSTALADAVAKIKSGQADKINEAIKNILKLNVDEYYDDSELKPEILRIFAEEQKKKAVNTTSDIRQTLNRATALARINFDPGFGGENDPVFAECAPVFGINLNGDYLNREFAVNTRALMKKIRGDKDFNTGYEFESCFNSALVTTAINLSALSEITGALEKYSDIFMQFDSSFLPKLSEDYRKLDITEVNKALHHMNFNSIEEVLTAFSSRISELISKQQNRTVTSGGGSAGSGGSKMQLVPQITEQPDKLIALDFGDISNVPWAVEAINTLCEKGVLNGFSEKVFAPDGFVTREQFVKMVVIGLELSQNGGECNFGDVKSDRWSYPYIAAAASSGIVKGIEQNIFGAEDNITRQDMAVILKRAIDAKEIQIKKGLEEIRPADFDSISEYASLAVDSLVSYGILRGDENRFFNPLSNCTRAEAAVAVYNLLNNMEVADE